MSFDALQYIMGRMGGSPLPSRPLLPYLMGKALSAVWKTIRNVAIATFTAVASPVRELVVDINPVQDLHGYDHPWPAGGGKNQFYPTTDGTASGVYNGVTCTRNNDGSFSFDGTAEASTWFNFGKVTLPAGTWTMSFVQTGTKENGNISLGANAGVFVSYPYTTTYPRTETAAEETIGNFGINFPSGCKLTNYTLWLQIEAGSPATSFAPYSNLCPISGWSEAKVSRTGKNLLDPATRTESGNNIRFTAALKAGQAYTFSASPNPQQITIRRTDNTEISHVYTAAITYTPTEDITVKFDVYYSPIPSGGLSSALCQLELGSTATDYEAYQGDTYTIDLDGTVYGAELDALAGKLTLNAVLEVFNSTANENEIASQLNYFGLTSGGGVDTIGDYTRVSFGVISGDQSAYNRVSSTYSRHLCNCLKHRFAYNEESAHWYRNTVLYAFFPTSLVGDTRESVLNYLVSIKDSNPLALWIPLATPIVIDVSPIAPTSLGGENNVWANCGDINTLTYREQ